LGFYDRDYYRDSKRPGGEWGLDNLTPAIKYLIIANVVVFLLQLLVVREVHRSPRETLRKFSPEVDKLLAKKEAEGPEALEKFRKKHPEYDQYFSDDEDDGVLSIFPDRVPILQEWLDLDTDKIIHSGQIWRFLTYAFCHERLGIFHILFNMICLYWFGATLESMYGTREFVLFYLAAAIVSGLTFVGLDLYTGSRIPAIGASGAVIAVMMLYTMHYPYDTIYIFWWFPLEMRWVMLLYLIWDLHPVLLALAGDHAMSGIAHSSHLGGLAFGFLYARKRWRLEKLTDRIVSRFQRMQSGTRLRLAREKLQPRPSAVDSEEIARILDKILASGEASLTEEEREVLRRESDRMKEENRG
jgi:membrane associated rhomboid family serine protease